MAIDKEMEERDQEITHFFLYALEFFAKLGIVALELLHSPGKRRVR